MTKVEAFNKIIKENVKLIKNEKSTKRAGYDIYDMFELDEAERVGWVSDLGNRLEVNTFDGATESVWYDSEFFNEDTFSFLLANWLKYYTEEVINMVLKKVELIRKDTTTIKLLFRLVKEISNDDKYLQASISHSLSTDLIERVKDDCLSKTRAIRETLNVLWIEN